MLWSELEGVSEQDNYDAGLTYLAKEMQPN